MIDGYENFVLENDDYTDHEWAIDGCADHEWVIDGYANLELVIDDCKDLEPMFDGYANLEKMDNGQVEIVLKLLFGSYLNVKTYTYFMNFNLIKHLNDVQYVYKSKLNSLSNQ
jgi:hypothetical protein